MKIVALEEHFVTKDIRDAWARLSPDRLDDSPIRAEGGAIGERLEDLADRRLRDMDDDGVDVQVLSLTTPGVQTLDADESVALARQVNDQIAATVKRRPDRFDGFATLPTPAPGEAARELQRAVTSLGLKGAMLCGRTGEKNLDHADFTPLYEAAASLRMPLYIHPQIPRRAVRDAYYTGFGAEVDYALATSALGWHFETGVQLLRLILAGTFDRHPDLQVIVGHWGEVVLFYLERIERLGERSHLSLERPLRDYFRQNVSYTPSGIFSQRYLQQTVDVVGVDRVLYAVDYPYVFEGGGKARSFLEQSALSQDDREKVAHGNWERLTARTG